MISSRDLNSIFLPMCENPRPEGETDVEYLARIPYVYDQIGYEAFPMGLREQLGIYETKLIENEFFSDIMNRNYEKVYEPLLTRIHPILQFLVNEYKTVEAFDELLRSMKAYEPMKLSIACCLARVVPLRTSDNFKIFLNNLGTETKEISFIKRLISIEDYQQHLMLCMYISRAEAMYKLCEEAFQVYMRLGYTLASHPIAVDSSLTYRIQRYYMSRVHHDTFDDIVDELKEDPLLAADFMYLFPAIEALSCVDPVIITDSRFFCERDYKRFISKFTRPADTGFGIPEKIKNLLESYESKFDELDETVKRSVDDLMALFNGNVACNETVADYFKSYLKVFEKIRDDYESDEEVSDEEMNEDSNASDDNSDDDSSDGEENDEENDEDNDEDNDDNDDNNDEVDDNDEDMEEDATNRNENRNVEENAEESCDDVDSYSSDDSPPYTGSREDTD